MSQEYWFDHEKLDVYREAIALVAWLSSLLEGSVRVGDVRDQLDRASTSIPLNIAEGNGKYAPKDRCRFFDIAHGSALECAAGLNILVAKAKLERFTFASPTCSPQLRIHGLQTIGVFPSRVAASVHSLEA